MATQTAKTNSNSNSKAKNNKFFKSSLLKHKEQLICCDMCGELFEQHEMIMGFEGKENVKLYCQECANKLVFGEYAY